MNELDGCVLALLVDAGASASQVRLLRADLHRRGARVHVVGLRAQPLEADDGRELPISAYAAELSPRYYDGLVLTHGRAVEAALDPRVLELLRACAEEAHPLAGMGSGVALLAAAGVLAGLRVACDPDLVEAVRLTGGVPRTDSIASAALITTARSDCDLDAFCEVLARDLQTVRTPDEVDETELESFPASDGRSGLAALHG